MSRCVVKIAEDKPDVREVAVGIISNWDTVAGEMRPFWFIQVFGEDDENGYETLFEDYEGVSEGKVLEILNEYSDRTDPYTNAVYDQVALDLDPGEINRLSFVSREVAEAVTVVSDLEYAMKNQEQ